MKKSKGYTPIEVVIVLAIIGIILSAGWNAFSGGSGHQHQQSDYYDDHQPTQHERYEE